MFPRPFLFLQSEFSHRKLVKKFPALLLAGFLKFLHHSEPDVSK
jgi:hypothetical protein